MTRQAVLPPSPSGAGPAISSGPPTGVHSTFSPFHYFILLFSLPSLVVVAEVYNNDIVRHSGDRSWRFEILKSRKGAPPSQRLLLPRLAEPNHTLVRHSSVSVWRHRNDVEHRLTQLWLCGQPRLGNVTRASNPTRDQRMNSDASDRRVKSSALSYF